MPNDDIIIVTRPKLALRPTGIVAHWRELWKEWSTGLIVLLAFMPEVLEVMIAQGWFSPADTSIAFKVVAGITIAAKLVSQKKPV